MCDFSLPLSASLICIQASSKVTPSKVISAESFDIIFCYVIALGLQLYMLQCANLTWAASNVGISLLCCVLDSFHGYLHEPPSDIDLEEVTKEVMGKLRDDWVKLQSYLGIPDDVMYELCRTWRKWKEQNTSTIETMVGYVRWQLSTAGRSPALML